MLCLVIAQPTGWMTGLWSHAYTSSVLVVPAHCLGLCFMLGQWLSLQAAHLLGSSRCAKMAVWGPLHHLLPTLLPIAQRPDGVSGSPSGLWKRPWYQPCLGHPLPCPSSRQPPHTPGQSTQTWRFYLAPTVYPLILWHRLRNPVRTADPALAPQNTQPGHFCDWWCQKLCFEATHAQDLQSADLHRTV